MKAIELLSPARDADHGIAAIQCGADAVYIGASRFGARSAAANDLHDIERLISYAHFYRAKVYVVLNTLLFDSELDQAFSLARDIWNAGADALIVQDMAFVEADLPPIPLFASTQAHNDSPEKIAFLEKSGFSRAILAREFSLEQIKAVREATSIELESFIHGALCVSFSGRCYLSYKVGGRSGNRGECAQPCRKKYDLLDSEGNTILSDKYLLSLRDLNLTSHIRQMIDAGVSSFKIEGRLKDSTYVRNVTAHYRRAIDAVLNSNEKKHSSGVVEPGFHPDPAKSFNRGFTSYFIEGRKGSVSSHETSKPTGEQIGTVVSSAGNILTVKTNAVITPGDGICCFDAQGNLSGGNVNAAEKNRITMHEPLSCVSGGSLFRNRDHLFEKEMSRAKGSRLVRCSISVGVSPDNTVISATASDEDGFTVSLQNAYPFEAAADESKAGRVIVEQLSKSGGTKFAVSSVSIQDDRMFFLPVSALNAIRRELLDGLDALRSRTAERVVRKTGDLSALCPEQNLGYEWNVTNRMAEQFYLRRGAASIEQGAEIRSRSEVMKLMTTKYCLKHELGLCSRFPLKRKIAGNLIPSEPLFLLSDDGRFRLKFNCAACVMELYSFPE